MALYITSEGVCALIYVTGSCNHCRRGNAENAAFDKTKCRVKMLFHPASFRKGFFLKKKKTYTKKTTMWFEQVCYL